MALQATSAAVGPRIVLILVCALFLLPFYWMVNTALKTPRIWSPIRPALADRVDLVQFPGRRRVHPVLAVLAQHLHHHGLTIIGSVISNPIIAYGFSRIEWPGRDQIFYLVLATVFIPFPVLIVALFDIFAKTPRPVLDGWQLAWGGTGSTPICRWWCRCSSATPSGSFSCGSS